MNFDEKLIRETVFGITRVTVEHGYYCFHRYAEAQERFYEFSNWDFFRKCYATAGVRFDFYTDSTEFSFDFELHSASSRRFYYFDVFVDGRYLTQFGEESPSSAQSRFCVKLPEGEKRVTVWFPCMYAAFVKNVCADGSFVKPAVFDKTLLAIGDSITHGYDAHLSSNAYPAILARTLGISVINQGIGGDVYHEGNIGEGLGFLPDFITVLLGTNDWAGRKRDRFTESVENYYALLDKYYPGVPKLVITPLWRGDCKRLTSVGRFSDAADVITREAKSYPGVSVVDGMKLIDHDDGLFSPDVLHPNDKGFENFASNLCPVFKKVFGL